MKLLDPTSLCPYDVNFACVMSAFGVECLTVEDPALNLARGQGIDDYRHALEKRIFVFVSLQPFV